MNYLKITNDNKISLIEEIPLFVKIFFWYTNKNRCCFPDGLIDVDAQSDWISEQILNALNGSEKQVLYTYLNMRYDGDFIDKKKLYEDITKLPSLALLLDNKLTKKETKHVTQYIKGLKKKINNNRIGKILDTAEIHYFDTKELLGQFWKKTKADIYTCYDR